VGFTLLALGASDGAVELFRAAADKLGVPLSVVVSGGDREALDRYRAPLVLVRPDQYVAWAGDSAEQAAEILGRAAGWAGR
jgi:hypothetical protein